MTERPTFAGLFYDPDGNEIDLFEWAAIGTGAEPGFSVVADTTTRSGVRVSTVWFGINSGRQGHAELVDYYGGEPDKGQETDDQT